MTSNIKKWLTATLAIFIMAVAFTATALSRQKTVVPELKVEQTIYNYPGNNPSDWKDPNAWHIGEPATSCNGLSIPCRIDLSQTDALTVADFLRSFGDDEYMDFLSHPAVTQKGV